jgi:hypothetical protein
LAAFSQDAETVKKTIEIGVDSYDMGRFIVVLQAETRESFWRVTWVPSSSWTTGASPSPHV